jgi:ribose transport system substrate-binding protein
MDRRQFTFTALGLALAGRAAHAQAPAPTTIGVSLPQDDNPFYIAMLRGIRARAQELGMTVIATSSQEDRQRQINGVQDMIARGVRGVLISPIDAVGVNAAYDAAAAARVPIVSVARGANTPNQTLHVAMDEKQIGRDIAEWTARKIANRGKVAMISGPAGAPTFRNLNEGYREVMAQHADIVIVLQTDGVALGAAQAVVAAGRRGRTVVTGMNGVPPALRAVKEGNLGLTVELNPANWGRLGVDVLAAYLRGERVQQQVFIPHVLIDETNVDAALARMAG